MSGAFKGFCSPLLMVSLLSLPAPAAAGGQDSSAIIYSRDESASPDWVSAQAATRPDGTIDWDLLGERARMLYESVLRSTPRMVVEAPGAEPKIDPDSSSLRPECVYYGAAYFHSPNLPPAETLDGYLKYAQAILRGRIIEITPGFYLGEPNSLLTVKLERKVRASKFYPESDTFYVVYPKARFSIGDVSLCKNYSKFPYEPKVGDRVLLLPLEGPQGKERRLIQPSPEELIIEKKDGGLVVPHKFSSTAAARKLSRLEDLEARALGCPVVDGNNNVHVFWGHFKMDGGVERDIVDIFFQTVDR